MHRTKIVGIVGTAKNTGKTTTLAALLKHCLECNMRVATTGIGYDGEERDAITALPKPRLLFHEQAIVATAEACLKATSAGYAVRRGTGVRTALGEVLIAEITRSGMLVIAGPNTIRSLHTVLDALSGLSPDLILVDGSLNRIAPMSAVDSVVFSTGASRATDPRFLAAEMRGVDRVFRLPRSTRGLFAADRATVENGLLMTRSAGSSLYDAEEAEAVCASFIPGGRATLMVPGFISAAALHTLCKNSLTSEAGLGEIIVRDALALLLAGQPIELDKILSAAADAGIIVSVAGGPYCSAITVNPFYPDLRDQSFVPAYIDKRALFDAVSNAVGVPVFNIEESGPAALMAACLREPVNY